MQLIKYISTVSQGLSIRKPKLSGILTQTRLWLHLIVVKVKIRGLVSENLSNWKTKKHTVSGKSSAKNWIYSYGFGNMWAYVIEAIAWRTEGQKGNKNEIKLPTQYYRRRRHVGLIVPIFVRNTTDLLLLHLLA